ncbi:unannotated protein [freshwater metagenome]|uniref:Unannotated protein n=1 Tax=freshwater metagenome TaxID=449393 RepID=A0A6J6IFW8_9ZZZZ
MGKVINMTLAATSGIETSAGSQSLIVFNASDEARVGAPARNFIHMANMPMMTMKPDAHARVVATSNWRRGAATGAAGSATVMPIPPVTMALHQELVRLSSRVEVQRSY